jgi:endonuclease/exonuclease/phosphatase family metal-dependent hydrolase
MAKRGRDGAALHVPPDTYSIMTYNLWNNLTNFQTREPALRRQLASLDPDVLLAQEVLPPITSCVLTALKTHTCIQQSQGDDPGWATECNIFWRKNLLEHVEHGSVDIGQKELERRLFWVRLRSIHSSKTSLFATAHFTWQGAEEEYKSDVNVRKDQSRRTAEALAQLRKGEVDEAVFFGGDLNEGWWPREILTRAGFKDCFAAMHLPARPTHPARPCVAYEEGNADHVLDWLFHRGTRVRVLLASVIKDMCGLSSDDPNEETCMSIQPSDHMPVMAVYRVSSS